MLPYGGSVVDGPGSRPPDAQGEAPQEPLGHLSRLGVALREADDVDEIARCLLSDLVTLPGVARVGFALTEGGGRRLRVVSTDEADADELDWTHIDAYDDVPLTAVVRTGEPVLGSLDDLESRFGGVVARQRRESIRAMAAWPLPGTGSPIGGIMLLFDEPQSFSDAQRLLLTAMARQAAEAVRRVRVASGRGPGETTADPELVGDGPRASVLLENDPQAAGAARRFLRRALADWEVDDEEVVETAQLLLSELVTNVVMHARTSSELTVHLDADVLTVVVRDLGGSTRSGEPAPVTVSDDEDPLKVFGRGLMLVEALADRWGSEQDATGTTAWFAIELGGPRESPAQTG